MSHNCKNCDHHFEGNYCNNCGQSAETHAINAHYLWHDVQHGILHFDKGILFTAKELFTRPGPSIREFIEGKRVQHFRPIALVFLLATFYGLLYHYFHINIMGPDNGSFPKIETKDIKITYEVINDWTGSHYSWVTLLCVPIFSLGSYIAFRKSGYNFMEHIVLNSFIAAQKMILAFAYFPLLYIFNGTKDIVIVNFISMFAEFGVTIWVYSGFFNEFSAMGRILRFLLSAVLSMLFFYTIILSVTYVFLLFAA